MAAVIGHVLHFSHRDIMAMPLRLIERYYDAAAAIQDAHRSHYATHQ